MGSAFEPPIKAGKQVADRGARVEGERGGAASPALAKKTALGGRAVPGRSLLGIPRSSAEELHGGLIVQAKLSGGALGDPLEREAENFAKGGWVPGGARWASRSGRELTSGMAGEPLDLRTRQAMEPRLNMDLGGVRVHSGGRATEQAHAFGAEAFTVGSDIVFNAGRYSPESDQGQRLLAHELAHVAQQASGRGEGTVQREPTKDADSQAIIFPFRLVVTHAMNPDETLREFIRQYFRISAEEQIAEKLKTWKTDFGGQLTALDAERGYVMIRVRTTYREYFGVKTEAEKKAVNDETDQRFWVSSGYKPGQKLGNSAEDKEKAKDWIKTRQSVLAEEIRRKQIEDLPKDIKDVLFAGDADATAVAPEDFDKILRLAGRLMQLTPTQRADYLSRVNASSTNYDDLDRSITAYLESQAEAQRKDEAADKAAKPLFGLEPLFETYKWWTATNGGRYSHVQRGGGVATHQSERDQTREAEFFAELKRQEFDDVWAFERSINAFLVAFQTQTVTMALDGLDRYEHMLFLEKKKLQKAGSGEAITKGIAGTKASEHFKSAHEAANKAGEFDAMNPGDGPNAAVDAQEAEFKEQKEQGNADVVRGAGDALVAERGIDLEKLAGLNAADAQAYLLKEIDTRQEQVKQTRAEFAEEPERIFNLPPLLQASIARHELEGTIYASIIKHHIEQQGIKKIFTAIAVTIIALALAALVPVGGVVAAAALLANAGISTYQAYQAYEEYKQSQNDYTLHFLDDQQSFGWVVLAMVAAAVDLGAATSQIFKISAKGLAKLEGPLKAFQKDRDAAKLTQEIERIDELERGVKNALEKQLQAEKAAEAAWADAPKLGLMAVMPTPLTLPAVALGFARPLFATIRKGIRTFAALRKDAEFLKAMGDITKMTGADRKVVEQAFEELKVVAAAGRKMDEPTLLTFVDRWAAGRAQGEAFQQKLVEEMKAWRPMTEAQKAAWSKLGDAKSLVRTLFEEKAAYIEEWNLLRAKPTRTKQELDRIQEIFKELRKLDPNWQEAALTSEEARRLALKDPHPPQGDIQRAQTALDKAEDVANKADITLYDRLRAAAPSEVAKEKALKGVLVDQVGPLRTKPTALQVDHIVSVNEITEMEGFKDLPWADQKRIVDMKQNLIPMDGAANASKSNRTWRSWPQWSNFYYEEATKVKMIAAEDTAREVIKAEIARLRKVPVGP